MSHFGNLTKNAENRRFDGKNEIFHLFGMELETNSFIRKTHCEQTDENEEQERLERGNGQNVGDLLELQKKKLARCSDEKKHKSSEIRTELKMHPNGYHSHKLAICVGQHPTD